MQPKAKTISAKVGEKLSLKDQLVFKPEGFKLKDNPDYDVIFSVNNPTDVYKVEEGTLKQVRRLEVSNEDFAALGIFDEETAIKNQSPVFPGLLYVDEVDTSEPRMLGFTAMLVDKTGQAVTVKNEAGYDLPYYAMFDISIYKDVERIETDHKAWEAFGKTGGVMYKKLPLPEIKVIPEDSKNKKMKYIFTDRNNKIYEEGPIIPDFTGDPYYQIMDGNIQFLKKPESGSVNLLALPETMYEEGKEFYIRTADNYNSAYNAVYTSFPIADPPSLPPSELKVLP